MDKIPDEIWLIAIIVLVVKVSSIVRSLLPYDPGDGYCHDLGATSATIDHATPDAARGAGYRRSAVF